MEEVPLEHGRGGTGVVGMESEGPAKADPTEEEVEGRRLDRMVNTRANEHADHDANESGMVGEKGMALGGG